MGIYKRLNYGEARNFFGKCSICGCKMSESLINFREGTICIGCVTHIKERFSSAF